MTSIGVSLEPIEDRFSIVLSRLERIEASLSGLEDVKKLLMKIEGNTHADDDGNSDFRHNWQEMVGFEIYLKQIADWNCFTLKEKFGKIPQTKDVNY